MKAGEVGELREQTLTENREALLDAAGDLRAALRRAAASCSRSATAARRPTRWTSSPTSVDPPPASAGRRGAAIDLTEDAAILTAIANDVGVEEIFQRQVIAYGRAGDAAARALDQRQLREPDRGARRGAAPRAA